MIAARYAQLRAQVPSTVTILAVTKRQPAGSVREAILAGVTDIGENYLQEASAKFDALDLPVRKHFIGHVQTNKARSIAQTFDMVQSVDRIEAGAALAAAASALGKCLPVLLQVNVSPAERFGCPPALVPDLAARLRALESLRLQGVMAIGPLAADDAELARAFALAAQAYERVGGGTLSLGMSGDWPQAVRAGSTMIRIGAALFGPRPAGPASKIA